MLHGDEFVALLACFHEGHVQADFEFLGNHRFLHHALKRMLMLFCKRDDLLHLGRGDVFRIHAADAHAFPVHFEHDLGRLLPGH